MKNVIIKYDKHGRLEDITNNFLLFEQENNSLSVNAYISTNKKVRAYIKSENNNSLVTNEILPVEGVYSLTIGDEYMVSGTLYVGYELYDDTGYIERLEPVKLYIESFVSLGTNKKDNVYVVSMKIGDVVTLEPDKQATVENVGTKKDMILNFGIPRGPQGIKGDKGDKGVQGIKGEPGYTPIKGVDYYTPDEKAELLDEAQKKTLEDIDKRIKYIHYDKTDTYVNEDGDEMFSGVNFDKLTEPGLYYVVDNRGYVEDYPEDEETMILLVDPLKFGTERTQTKIRNGRIYIRNWDIWDNWMEWREVYAEKISTITYEDSRTSLYLSGKCEHRLGELSSLTLSMPRSIDESYESYFTFSSGETPTSLTYSSTPIRWSGDDVDYDGVFIPEANKIYEVAVKYLGDDAEGNPIISARVGVV